MGGSRQNIGVGLLLITLLLVAAPCLATGPNGVIVLGRSGPNKSGLTLTIDPNWQSTNGYRPVTLNFSSTIPSAADRTLQVELQPTSDYGLPGVRVRRTIVLSAGSNGCVETVAVPQWDLWQNLRVDVSENGTPIPEISGASGVGEYATTLGLPVPAGSSTPISISAGGNVPSILLIGDSTFAPNSILVPPYSPTNAVELQQNGRALGIKLTPTLSGTGIPLAELPDDWIYYSGFDLVLVRLDLLHAFAKKYPAKLAAIRRMVACGGNLWVYDAAGPKGRGMLEDLLNLPRASPAGMSPATKSTGDWHGFAVTSDGGARGAHEYATRALGVGQLVAISQKDAFAAGFDWNVVKTVNEKRLQWTAYHGVALDPPQTNANVTNFWLFLIPGVGFTPVVQFQIMISLFVIVIGPVNFFLLRRVQKTNLLPITVGIGAAVVTLALFSYALIHDGLGVRVRVRSFTQLDQRRGEAVSLSRMSYYAGMSPSSGLTFSRDTAVYPLRTPLQSGQPLVMEWTGEQGSQTSQHLSSGWLPARTPTQLVTVRDCPSAAKLLVSMATDGRIASVENRLGTRIQLLMLTDASGHVFQAENIGHEDRAAVREVDRADARIFLSNRIAQSELKLPTGTDAKWFDLREANPPQNYGNIMYSGTDEINAADSVLEQSLKHAADLPPRSFVAITDRPPEVEPGLSAHEEASLHVIVGKLGTGN